MRVWPKIYDKSKQHTSVILIKAMHTNKILQCNYMEVKCEIEIKKLESLKEMLRQ